MANIYKKADEKKKRVPGGAGTPKNEPVVEEVTEAATEVAQTEEVVEKATETAQDAPKEEKETKDTSKTKKPATAKKTVKKEKEEKPASTGGGFLDNLQVVKKVNKQNATYSLSVANIEKLAEVKEQKGYRSLSETLDVILTQVFSE